MALVILGYILCRVRLWWLVGLPLEVLNYPYYAVLCGKNRIGWTCPKINVDECDWVYPILIQISQYYKLRGKIKYKSDYLPSKMSEKIIDFSLNNWISTREIIPISFNFVEEKNIAV